MHCYRITSLWQRLDLPTPFLSEAILAGMKAAKKPNASLRDCPYNIHPNWHDRFTRKCRVAWRLAFRCQRERGGESSWRKPLLIGAEGE